jgi:hypothetical protein
MLAEGGLFGGAANSWAAFQVGMLKAQQSPGVLDHLKDFAARGLANVVEALPVIPGGVPETLRLLMQGVKDAVVSGIRHIFERKDEWSPEGILAGFKWAMSVMGRPYGWGAGHGGWNFNLPRYDCSGFASHAAKKSGSSIGSPGTTMSLFPGSHHANGNEAALWGFRGMSSGDPRRQHMGFRALGTWFQFGDPGRSGGSDSQWDHLRTIPGLPGYANGTSYVPDTGPAFLHRGEMVVPSGAADRVRSGSGSASALVHVETMVVQDATDIDRFASRLGRQLAMRVPA